MRQSGRRSAALSSGYVHTYERMRSRSLESRIRDLVPSVECFVRTTTRFTSFEEASARQSLQLYSSSGIHPRTMSTFCISAPSPLFAHGLPIALLAIPHPYSMDVCTYLATFNRQGSPSSNDNRKTQSKISPKPHPIQALMHLLLDIQFSFPRYGLS